MTFIITLFFLISTPIENPQTQPDSTINDKAQIVNKSTTDYEELYKLSQTYNEKILNTVYWAIGGIFAAIIGIIGSNIFFNYRFNRKEIENIIQKYDGKFESLKNEHSNYIKEQFSTFKESTTESLNDKADSNLEDYKEKVNLVKSTFDEKFSSIKNTVEKNEEVNSKKLAELESLFNRKVNEIGTILHEHGAKLYRMEGKKSFAIDSYLNAGLNRLDEDGDVFTTLYHISNLLQKSEKIYKTHKAKLKKFLDKVPSDDFNDPFVEEIEKALAKLEVEEI